MKKIKTLFLTLLIMSLLTSPSLAQEEAMVMSAEEKEEIVAGIISSYSNWGKVELTGKLRMDILPVAVTMKIFMEKERRLMISLRAPFIGEAGIVEIDGDSVLLVNRMKKVYARASLQNDMPLWKGGLGEIQNFLLSRIVLFGEGQLSLRNCCFFNIFSPGDETDGWVLIPDKDHQPDNMQYGYTVDSSCRLTSVMAALSDGSAEMEISYSLSGRNTVMDIAIETGDRLTEAQMDLNPPRWGAEPMELFNLSSKFTEVSPSKFFRSF